MVVMILSYRSDHGLSTSPAREIVTSIDKPYAARMAENTEAAALKARRQSAKTTAPKTPPPAPAPPQVGNDSLSGIPSTPTAPAPAPRESNYFMLSDHRPERQVLETGGMYGGDVLGDDFVRAETNAVETIYPTGCKTPVHRTLWLAGQHVPIERYNAWKASQAAATEQAESGAADADEAARQAAEDKAAAEAAVKAKAGAPS